jgi:hypothetical protein
MKDELKFPSEIKKSMAPFMYSMTANRIVNNEDTVTYKCAHQIVTISNDKKTAKREWCPFTVSIDPRDMTVQTIQILFSQHWEQREHE